MSGILDSMLRNALQLISLLYRLHPVGPVAYMVATAPVLLSASLTAQQLRYDREYPEIGYYTHQPTDPVAELQRSVARGEAVLTFDPRGGYLASLLESLDVPVESQMLVFSRTSFQERFISPETPRALYFSDEVYVAWPQGSDFVEIAAMDPALGPVFYTLSQAPTATPEFRREYGLCLQCHDTYGLSGGGVPRFLIGSGATNELGEPDSHNAWQLTTDQTPLDRRWGGWYVTGTHGQQVHMGNVVTEVRTGDPASRPAAPETHGNLTDLGGLLDTSPYLTGLSDIVALMVVEHQIHVQNVMTRAGWEARKSGGPEGSGQAPSNIEELGEPLVRAILLVDEAALEAPIEGTSGFRARFEGLGPADDEGRSLRELDLRRRLFRYPLSYLVYSDAFGALPVHLKEQVFLRIWEVASGQDKTEDFDHVTAADGVAVLEILEATHPEFAQWMSDTASRP